MVYDEFLREEEVLTCEMIMPQTDTKFLTELRVLISDLANTVNTKAPLANPNLTAIPTAPTPNIGTNSTQIATTAFVADTIGAQTISTAAPTGGANNDTWYQY